VIYFRNIRRRYCRTGWTRISSKLLLISSPNIDGFYRFVSHKFVFVSLATATELRYGGTFSNHFITNKYLITNFPQNVPLKKIW